MLSDELWHVKAPSSMKSVLLAGWLLTTACGNLIDVLVTATRVISQVSSLQPVMSVSKFAVLSE